MKRRKRATETWLFNDTEDEGWSSDECNTREEAIKLGRENYGDECHFYVGRKGPMAAIPTGGMADAEMVVDRIVDHIYEEAGDGASDQFEPTDAQREDLQARLDKTVAAWAKANKLSLDWFAVQNVEHVEAINTDPADSNGGVRP